MVFATTVSPLRVVVDASVLISSLLTFDSNHASALNWINRHLAAGGELEAPLLLVPETAGALARITQNSSFANGAANQLYTRPFLRLTPMDRSLIDETVDVATAFYLRGADAMYVALARRLNVPLVSFDNEQLTRPTAAITTIRP